MAVSAGMGAGSRGRAEGRLPVPSVRESGGENDGGFAC